MVDSGNLMGVVTTGAGIVIMTGVACHTMRMVDRSMGGGMNRSRRTSSYTPYRRTPARARTTSSRRSTSSRRRR